MDDKELYFYPDEKALYIENKTRAKWDSSDIISIKTDLICWYYINILVFYLLFIHKCIYKSFKGENFIARLDLVDGFKLILNSMMLLFKLAVNRLKLAVIRECA